MVTFQGDPSILEVGSKRLELRLQNLAVPGKARGLQVVSSSHSLSNRQEKIGDILLPISSYLKPHLRQVTLGRIC